MIIVVVYRKVEYDKKDKTKTEYTNRQRQWI